MMMVRMRTVELFSWILGAVEEVEKVLVEMAMEEVWADSVVLAMPTLIIFLPWLSPHLLLLLLLVC
jgi:hypothetical protein